MAEYINRDKLLKRANEVSGGSFSTGLILAAILNAPAADVFEIVRCKDCKHCIELAPHCELNRYAYFHCNLWRGEETKNVWHKYKKYTADYSIVEPTDFCSYGERKDGTGE